MASATCPESGLILSGACGKTMGTVWRVKAYVDPESPLHLSDIVTPVLAGICDEMDHWRDDSLITRFNRSSVGDRFELPSRFHTVLSTAVQIAQETGWAFTPCAFDYSCAQGYGPEMVSEPQVPVCENNFYDPKSRILTQPGGVRLDLSALAKGYTLDLIAKALEAVGCSHFLIEIGGEFVARGVKADWEPWWVDIAAEPSANNRVRVALLNQALATSGVPAGTPDPHKHHILVSERAENPLRRVSVLAPTCLLADAYATAQFAMGTLTPLCRDIQIIAWA